MIQSLIKYYGSMEDTAEGWNKLPVRYALIIDEEGRLKTVEFIGKTETIPAKGKTKEKTVDTPRLLLLPAHPKRTSGTLPNFLADKIDYLLGVPDGNEEKAHERFNACKELHLEILKDADSGCAGALKAFFENWQPERWQEYPCLTENLKDLSKETNVVFRCDFYGRAGKYPHEDDIVKRAWDDHYSSGGEEGEAKGENVVCLATGKIGPAERVHPGIRGVGGNESSLVSFNNAAFSSYGKEQSYNAPMSKYATFAYTSALNALVKDDKSCFRMGDTTVLFWAEEGSKGFGSLFEEFALKGGISYSNEELMEKVSRICNGLITDYNDDLIDPDKNFYILGLDPNKGRLSVSFFMKNSFKSFINNIQAHRVRTTIVGCDGLSVGAMLFALKGEKSKDPVHRNLRIDAFKAVLNDTLYPASILNGVHIRILAEHDVTPARAAIIKAYYSKNKNKNVPEEVLQMSLNRQSKNIPYNLGRLFAVLEYAQGKAINVTDTTATISDRFFSSASSTPAQVFPALIRLAQNHLSKLDDGLRIYCDREITEIIDAMDEDWPKKLDLAQQGAFQLGYYHEKKDLYTKKEK